MILSSLVMEDPVTELLPYPSLLQGQKKLIFYDRNLKCEPFLVKVKGHEWAYAVILI